MAERLSPGVYIEEINTGPRPIEGVGTSMAAFVGFAASGPVNKPVLITSWEQYVQTFGGLQEGGVRNGYMDGSYLGYSIFGYFNNGGRRCYVIRLPLMSGESAEKASANRALEAQVPTRASKAINILSFHPKGNPQSDISIEVSPPSSDDAGEGAFNLRVKMDDVEEVFENLIPGKPAKGGKGRGVVEAVQTSRLVTVVLEDKAATTLAERAPELGTFMLKANTSLELAQVQPGTFIGNVDDRSGLEGLEVLEDVTMVAIPDLMAMYQRGMIDADGVKAVQIALINHCERMQDRMAIIDPLPDLKPQAVKKWREKDSNFDSKFAALYYPWVKVADTNGKPITVPPSAFMAGIWSRSDAERGVHKAPANEIVRGALGPAYEVTSNEQDTLNPIGINCIRTFTNRGVRVWGARTLSSDADWRYINVRRLFNYVQKSMFYGTQWVVFEPNDINLWERVKRDITGFLLGVWRDGALFGKTQQEAFFVQVDEQNNPEESRNLGLLNVNIGLSPVKPAEFVVLKFYQKMQSE
jgi:uncharacterized protein